MTSFFPFSSSTTSISQLVNNDDPHLQVIVTPSASAFYAGETFSVTITFKNTRTPSADAPHPPATSLPTGTEAPSAMRSLPPATDRHGQATVLPKRKGLVGRTPSLDDENAEASNAEAGPSRLPLSAMTGKEADAAGYPYSPGANPAFRAGWPSSEEGVTVRSPEAWRRGGYGDTGGGRGGEPGHGRRARSLALGKGVSPQEMVWALGGQPKPPPLPTRRPQATGIPRHHPHSRQISITSTIASPPGSTTALPLTSPDLDPIPEGSGPLTGQISSGIPSRPLSRSTVSSSGASSASASRSNVSLTDNESRTSSDITASRRRPQVSPLHTRTPSYQNAYGAFSLNTPTQPPPSHPYIRSQEPRGITTILWAYTQLVGHFHPSNTYIPPDPLLPLRSMLLHQPIGSGSLMSPSSSVEGNMGGATKPSSSRWQLSFGTGTIGNSSQPSLTGSLFGLAKGIVSGGSSGSLEEERKRVWNTKDLPVLETSKSLLGVDVKLQEGEEREFTYTMQLPTTLAPSHRGRAFRFSYDLVVSLTVGLPGKGHRQKAKEITVPIRIWANVSITHPLGTYDVLKPVMQKTDEGRVEEPQSSGNGRRRSTAMERSRSWNPETARTVEAYAKHLLSTLEAEASPSSSSTRLAPLSPSKTGPRNRVISASMYQLDLPSDQISIKSSDTKRRGRKGSFIAGDDELVEQGMDEGGCGQAVEVLSRHSLKSSYDIGKDGDLVAVLTLVKTTYRLGESVLGVFAFNGHSSKRRVLRVSAYLESQEVIPENLLPSTGPPRASALTRLHAENHSAYTVQTSQLPISLEIPSDATPAFSLTAGLDGFKGGLEWRVKLSFLVSKPGVHLTPNAGGDADNTSYSSVPTLAPVIHKEASSKEGREWAELHTEIVECDIPIKVLAGNTAFVVNSTTHVV